jgi:hypothetical protein
LSPQNQIFNESSVPLVFIVDKDVSWSGYSLDNQSVVTINGNATIANVTNGVDSVTVYVNDTFGNYVASQTINFTVAVPPKPFPVATIIVAVSVAVAAVVVAGLSLVIFKKRKR